MQPILTRIDNWDAAFHAVLDDWAAAPFEYGSRDCALLAADVVLALTGTDFGAPFRGRYRSAAGSVRALRLYGAGDLPATLTAALGAPVHPAFAGRGDIVMLGGNAGVCTGGQSLFVGDAGLEARATADCQMAWRV